MHKPRRSEIEEALAETIFNRGLFRRRGSRPWCSIPLKRAFPSPGHWILLGPGTEGSLRTVAQAGNCKFPFLVGGLTCFNHLEKYESQWEGLSHILWKIKNVPNHQPDLLRWFSSAKVERLITSIPDEDPWWRRWFQPSLGITVWGQMENDQTIEHDQANNGW